MEDPFIREHIEGKFIKDNFLYLSSISIYFILMCIFTWRLLCFRFVKKHSNPGPNQTYQTLYSYTYSICIQSK